VHTPSAKQGCGACFAALAGRRSCSLHTIGSRRRLSSQRRPVWLSTGTCGTLNSMGDAPSAIGRRIVVTGMAGSGKSTFSRSLAVKTGLPVVHLDLHFWKPGWVAPDESDWREKQSGLLAGDAWIVDGNYHETLDLRLGRADTVVFLDIPWSVCAGRAVRRGLRKPAGEMPAGCDDSPWRRLRDEWRLAVVIWRNRRSEPEREYEVISQHGQHAAFYVLRSKRAAKEFLDGLDIEDTKADAG
jgi:adenylate kinase family enzyme